MIYVYGALAGVVAGSAYSLVGVSLTLMFRSTGVLSFAHAAFAMLGAYLYADLGQEWPDPLAALVALVAVVAYGLLVERLVIRAVRDAPPTMKLIATLGVLATTTGLILVRYGARLGIPAELLLPNGYITLGNLRVEYQQLAVLGVAGAGAGGLAWFLQRTRFGTAVRAVAQNLEAARLMGVSLNDVGRFNWALGALLAGATGILIAPVTLFSVATFPLLLLKALTACLVGGLASLPLTFAGGLLLGGLEGTVQAWSARTGNPELVTLAMVVILLAARRSWPSEGEGPLLDAPRRATRRLLPRFVSWRGPVFDRLRHLGPAAAGLAAVVAVPLVGLAIIVPARSEFWGYTGARALFYVIEALSLVILAGWAGQTSLMHGAYVGIGAFVTATLTYGHDVPLELAIPIAAAAGTALGALAGLPALRLTNLQFAIASLAFSGAVTEWLLQRPQLHRQLPRGELFGVDLFDSGNLYLIMLPVTGLLYFGVWRLRRSTFGALLIASRDDPATVAHFGANPNRTRMWAFALASFIATLGGAFWGILLTSFQPFDFSFQLSVGLLLFAVIGGIDSLGGPIVAGFAFGVLPQLVQQQSGTQTSAWPDVISGAVVIALVALRPRGLASAFDRLRRPSPAGARLTTAGGRFRPLIASRNTTVEQPESVMEPAR